MAASGKKIPREELSPGDLVSIATTADTGAVSHVAPYIGQDSIIHAISDGPDRGVNITPLSSRYWKAHYHSAVRVLPAEEKNRTETVKVDAPVRFAKGEYSGALRDGEPEGTGVLRLNNGDVYRGMFKDGRFAGQGVYAWKSGEKYEGGFADDAFHGKGVLTSAAGTTQAVVFDRGVRLQGATVAAQEPAVKPASSPVLMETYIQQEDSPWDTWTGYISGDYDQWKAAQDRKFEASKQAYDKNGEAGAFEEWKKTSR